MRQTDEPREKLVRDHIPHIIRKSGHPCALDSEYRKAAPEEMKDLLNLKLREEADELLRATTQQQALEELADLYTVIESLAREHHLDMRQVRSEVVAKEKDKGAFWNRYVLFLNRSGEKL